MFKFKLEFFSKNHSVMTLKFKGKTYKRIFKLVNDCEIKKMDIDGEWFLLQLKNNGEEVEEWMRDAIYDLEKSSEVIIANSMFGGESYV